MTPELPVCNGLSISFDTSEDDFLADMGLDQAEALMMQGEPIEVPTTHCFIDGYYIRTVVMPKGSLIASKIHRTEHRYQIIKGDVSVWIEGTGTVRLKGPYQGTTYPGTRRLLYCHEETTWQTFHPREDHEVTPEQVEARIIEPHYNPIVGLSHAEMARLTNHDHLCIGNE